MKILFLKRAFLVEPLGIMYLSAALKNKGHTTDIVLTDEDVDSKVLEFKPDIICYSVMTGEHKEYLAVNRKLKEKFNFISFFGGPHPTFFPEMINDSGVDIICRGEGEQAIVELAEALSRKRPFAHLSSLWVKVKRGEVTEIVRNHVAKYSDNLDDYPAPDREIIYKYEKYRNNPIKHFIVSRGCPFDCSYCFNKAYHDLQHKDSKRIRFHSVERVIEEINGVISKYPTKMIYFQDDTFILNKEWVKEFSEKYKKEINLPYHCHVRANLATDDVIRYLKESNCFSVHIAAESGDERIRNVILNRNMSEEQILNASSILRKYGIRFMIQNMIGLPTEKFEDAIKTLELNTRCQPTYAWVSLFQPYPGTRIAKLCGELGLFKDISIDNIKDNFFEDSPIVIADKHKFINLQRLFAIIVEYPFLLQSGIYKVLIDRPVEETKEIYKAAYRRFRDMKDNELYGLELNKL